MQVHNWRGSQLGNFSRSGDRDGGYRSLGSAAPRYVAPPPASHTGMRVRDVSTPLENELAPEMARLAQSMGVGGLRQAIELDLRREYGLRLKQVGNAFEMSTGSSNRRPERRYVITIGFWRL